MNPILKYEDFTAKRDVDRRLARLTRGVTQSSCLGLEFGASNNPTSLPDTTLVKYVDYTAERTEQASAPIDYVWSGSGLLSAICGQSESFDFAIAAQVAQYVPNLLGWFRGIFEVLKVGGILNISVPDKRFMFDVKRTPSTLGALIEAFHHDRAQPSPQQVFDHTLGASAVDPGAMWRTNVDIAALPPFCGDHALALAYRQSQEALKPNTYVTCHCWVFTPLSFLDLIEGATKLGLFPFVIDQFHTTEAGSWEFFVSFRRDAERDQTALLGKQIAAIEQIRDGAERLQRVAHLLATPT